MKKKAFIQLLENFKKQDPDMFRDFFFDKFLDNLSLGQFKEPKKFQDTITKMLVDAMPVKELTAYMVDEGITLNETVPKTKHNYIGIEIECFSEVEEDEVFRLALEHGLEKNLDIGDDSSIEVEEGRDYELRILTRETELSSTMKKLETFLKAGQFQVNESCGLHVHLDMRQRDWNKAYNRLRMFQDLMFGMVSKDRRDNSEYCQYTTNSNENGRYVAINKASYESRKTIEIRLHQGSVNAKQIHNWINLLLKILVSKTAPAMTNKSAVLKWAKDKSLKSYIRKEFNPNWKDNWNEPDDEYDEDDNW